MKQWILKLLKIIGITLTVFLAGLIILIFFTGPKLPENADSIIDQVLDSTIPELVKGKSGYIVSDHTKIWYESVMPKNTNKGAVLLFMGISNDALGWPQKFIDKFVENGYQVIRFDYRGTGFSDWVENWEEKPYALADLATDAKIILDTLKIKKVHLVGVSLGGMVAQEFAIKYTDRTKTLTSIMSSGNITDPELPQISKRVVFDLVKTAIKYGIISNEKNTIKLQLAARTILRGNAHYPINVKDISGQILYNLRKRNGYNLNASSQHHEATYRSGSRYDQLKELKLPVLIIHGINDPFIPIEHSKKLAKIIPHSKTKWFENMGHDIQPVHMEAISQEIILNFGSDR